MTSSAEETQAYEFAVVGHRGFLGGAISSLAAAAGLRVANFGQEYPAVRDGALAPELVGGSVRTVVWCASRINPRIAMESPELVTADLADLREFLDLAAADSPPHVILLSSGGTVYGPPEQPPFSESDELSPVNEYGTAKVRMEELLDAHAVPGTALRLANAYGPGQKPAPGQGVLAHWMRAIREGDPVVLFGDPSATRDYVYVDDIARAVVAIHHNRSQAPSVVNIGSGRATSLEELLETLHLAVAPVSFEVRREPGRNTDASHSVLDISLAAQTLNWEPVVPLADGVLAQWESLAS